jgi:hypothetical protein
MGKKEERVADKKAAIEKVAAKEEEGLAGGVGA